MAAVPSFRALKLEWMEVAACHAPVGFGVGKRLYAKHGLRGWSSSIRAPVGQTPIQAPATHETETGLGRLYDWLKPLEQGLNVKLFAGSWLPANGDYHEANKDAIRCVATANLGGYLDRSGKDRQPHYR